MAVKSEVPSISGVEEIREITRRVIALVVLGAYVAILIIIVLFGQMLLQVDTDGMLKVLTATAGVLGGVVGAVIGFYFNERSE